MGQEHGRSATQSLTMRGYGPEAQQHIYRATEETGTDPHDVPDAVLDVLATGGGQSLDASIQRALEERMDADFSDVEIHTGPAAAKAADAIDARAFTCGNAIVFNDGEYDPESAEGQHLLAHELAHVKQQTGAAISMMPQADADLEIDPDPQLEREADQAAEDALSGDEPLIVNRLGADVHIQRWKDQPRDAYGRFDQKDLDQYPHKKWGRQKRPPYARGQVEEVWRRADTDAEALDTGQVPDPHEPWRILTWDGGSRKGAWEMGHKQGREYRYLVEYYLQDVISEAEFRREYQNPDHYHPQHPDTNRSGQYDGEGEYWVSKWGTLEDNQ
ncbi:eCIS core domain-containing protein [Halovivax ruber]